MRYDRYAVEETDSLVEFEFYSEGPNGRIKKKIEFVPFSQSSRVYNQSFGDASTDGEIDDLSVTNNGDSQKVLATVATVVYKFLEQQPESYIYATGSTKARVRLYRMGISNNLAEINTDFLVFGFRKNGWETFEKGKEYEAFLVKKRTFGYDEV
jgi:hypothetical protein